MWITSWKISRRRPPRGGGAGPGASLADERDPLVAGLSAVLFAGDLPTGTRPTCPGTPAEIRAAAHRHGGVGGCMERVADGGRDAAEARRRMEWARECARWFSARRPGRPRPGSPAPPVTGAGPPPASR
ncbi:hypothetical protein ACSNOI_09945 [Actinomadura kijaniata]|uniref:hypothetical protein n=1 Tax=Actinomadura kijaniata TaxID=46161 RepID=UPI003F1BA9DD